MQVLGDYHRDGYAHLQGLIPAEVAAAFMQGLKEDLEPGAIALSKVDKHPNLLKRAAFGAVGSAYR
jgi:hypothetical protein